MNLGLEGKVAVVTASSKGLGKAVAEQLAREGANLAICSRNEQGIAAIADELRENFGIKVISAGVDVSDAVSIKRFMAMIGETYGRIDALLCSAGGPPSGDFLSFDDSAWEKAFQTNLMSAVRLVRESFPYMEQAGGKIVTIASTSVKMPIPGLVLSNTFRTAAAGLMKTLSIELAPYGILVNTVCPGRISTDRIIEIDQAAAEKHGKSFETVQSENLRNIPLGRYGKPEELAVFSAYLLSPLNSYMTGSTFFVDGGMVKAL